MKEIKFRAWDNNEKVMITSGTSMATIIAKELKGYGKGLQNGNGEVVKGDYEIMQYTGLKDKNGKEIYEGDIVLIDTGHHGDRLLIEWDDEFSCFSCRDIDIPEYFYCGEEMRHLDKGEVIGNIHLIYENQDLIKE